MTLLGDALREALEDHHWTQTDLSDVLGRPIQLVNELVGGKRGLSPEVAVDLSEAFGNDPMDWAQLDIQDRLAKSKPVDVEGIRSRREIVEERLSGRVFKATVKETAGRIIDLARQLESAPDRATILDLATALRGYVATLPKQPHRTRIAGARRKSA